MILPHGRPLPLFPPANVLDSGTVILVEGIFDVLNLYDKGITNVITGFGLIKPKKRNKNYFEIHDRFAPYKIMGMTRLIIMYDSDKAGKDASYSLQRALEDYVTTEIFELPDGKDPGGLDENEVYELRKSIYENSSSN